MERGSALSKGERRPGEAPRVPSLAWVRLRPRPDSLPALTGLRFVAAFAVFVEHSREVFDLPYPSLKMLGGVAVSFFFVLSGFILTYVYGAELERRDIPRFWLARWARIWPLHIACLLAAILLAPHHNFPTDAEGWRRLATHVALLQTWSTDPGWTLAFNGPAWSISVELFFYLSFPLLARLSNRRFAAALAAILASTLVIVALGEAWMTGDAERSKLLRHLLRFLPWMRLLEFTTGLAVARIFLTGWGATVFRRGIWVHLSLELCAVLAVALAWYLLGPAGGLHPVVKLGQHVAWAVYLQAGAGFAPAFAVVVWILARSRGALSRLLSTQLLVWLGETSFALYLIHRPVLTSIQERYASLDLRWQTPALSALVISLAAAGLLHSLVEAPCRQWILSIGRKRTVATSPAPRAWRWLATLAASLVLTTWNLERIRDTELRDTVSRAVAECPGELNGATFESEGTLLGVSLRRDESRLTIDVAWKPEPTASREPFFHLCGPDGAIVGHPRATLASFDDPVRGKLRLATVIVTARQLETCSSLGFGFYSPELKATRVDRGPRSMGEHRLDLAKAPFEARK
jgi:peptidoglycan/LPS O-acetylase OafA/YrhL